MFYSAQVLGKKGPLATIWIAAHLDKRLKRHDVFSTSIPKSVGKLTAQLAAMPNLAQLSWQLMKSFAVPADSIIDPDMPLALRLSGQLLLGVVKIYSKKVGFLFDDCNRAVIKVQQVCQACATPS